MDVRFRCRNPECREPITRRNQIWCSEACRQDGAPAAGGDALAGRLGRWRETPDGTVWHFELPADLAGLGPPLAPTLRDLIRLGQRLRLRQIIKLGHHRLQP